MNLGHWADKKPELCAYLDTRRKYLGQMDLNLKSPLVWDFYKDTLKKLAGYGAAIIRLDAFAYAPKAPGSHNFMNEPETWDTLEQVRKLAEPYGLTLLPEIHTAYGTASANPARLRSRRTLSDRMYSSTEPWSRPAYAPSESASQACRKNILSRYFFPG